LIKDDAYSRELTDKSLRLTLQKAYVSKRDMSVNEKLRHDQLRTVNSILINVQRQDPREVIKLLLGRC